MERDIYSYTTPCFNLKVCVSCPVKHPRKCQQRKTKYDVLLPVRCRVEKSFGESFCLHFHCWEVMVREVCSPFLGTNSLNTIAFEIRTLIHSDFRLLLCRSRIIPMNITVVRFILSVSGEHIKQQISKLYVIVFCLMYTELHLKY